jgi:cytochrome c553
MPAFAAGDAAAGQAKSAICAACHGADGNSVVPNWPKLAGQHEPYLVRQVALIKSGARTVPEMAGIVPGLTDQDIADLAAWFASRQGAGGVADETKLALGERIFRAGNAESGVPACMACHGPAGEGNPLAVTRGGRAARGIHCQHADALPRRGELGRERCLQPGHEWCRGQVERRGNRRRRQLHPGPAPEDRMN